MAVNRQPILKRCRSLGLDPIVLGINKKSNRNPGGDGRKKLTEYAIQLKEKQKVKFVYGMLEKPFYKYYIEATKKEGVTGEMLLSFLERRLDNVIFRLGLVKTRRQSRQVVSHGHIAVNGKKVNIASYRLKVGDIVSVLEKSKDTVIIKEAVDVNKGVPSWLEFDKDKLEGKVIQLPKREDVDFDVNEQLIIEFYSR